MPDGRTPQPGGWNRVHFIVEDIAAEVQRLRAAGLTFRSDIVSGPGGQQILLEDSAGNPIELFQPAGSPADSYGGFVIIPLMQHDAVDTYHWMTDGQFLNAVALGQVTPGPVVHTVAVVGYAAAGVGGGLLAAAVAFAPSFSFILVGAERFDRLRANNSVRAFLDAAGPAAIGAIAGAAIALALALTETWQFAVLAAAALALFVLRRGVVVTLLAAGAAGAVASTLGAALPS